MDKLLIDTATIVAKTFKRDPTNDETRLIIDLINSTRVRNPYQLAEMFTQRYTQPKLQANRLDHTPIDIKEILKNHIGTERKDPDYEAVNRVNERGEPTLYNIPQVENAPTLTNLGTVNLLKMLTKAETVGNLESLFGFDKEVDIQRIFNPKALYRKNFVILDSRYRNTSTDTSSAINVFQWQFIGNSAINSPGVVNSIGDISNIVSVSVGDIRIPAPSYINNYKRITVGVAEWGNQSYIAQENRKFHFMFKTEVDGNMVNCSPVIHDKATFEFAKPINFDNLTISFGSPLETINFDMDRMQMTIGFTNPATFTSANNHNLQNGDQVYISTYVGDNANAVNLVDGYAVSVINNNSFSIPVDLSTAVSPLTAVEVYFGSKRFFIPLEVSYIKN